MAKPAKVMQAPDAQSAADDGDTETLKRAVAKHELIDDQAMTVESEEEASGIKYTLLANNQEFTWIYGRNPAADKMLAIFGAKTLATNERSASYQQKGTPDEQMAAIRDRFNLLDTGKWVDRTRDGVGARVDKDALAEAICIVLVGEGKKSQADIANGYKAEIRQKLEDDVAYARKARQHTKVGTEYARLVGKSTVTVDDLMA